MGIPVASGFTRMGAVPLDEEAYLSDLTARDAIVSGKRYPGYMVHVASEGKYFYLKGGITNSHWEEVGAGALPDPSGEPDGNILTVASGVPVWAPPPAVPTASSGWAKPTWNSPAGEGYILSEEFGFKVYLMTPGEGLIRALVKVPKSYEAGTQVFLMLGAFNNIDGDQWNIQATAYLIRPLIQEPDSVIYAENNSTGDMGLAGIGVLHQASIALTDASGNIGGEPIAVDDYIRIDIERTGTEGSPDTPENVRLLFETMEIYAE